MNRHLVSFALCAAILACSNQESVGSITALAVPVGSDASLDSSTVPTTMFPGERQLVTVTMRNDGATAGVNTWDGTYRLYRNGGTNFAFTSAVVSGSVAPGATHAFTFVVRAPSTPGSYTFRVRMGQAGEGLFGDIVSIPVTVDAGATPVWGCAVSADDVPTMLTPGESRAVSVTVDNTGTATWNGGQLSFYSQDTPASLWSNTTSPLTTTVTPGGSATFNFTITAPSAPGTYSLTRQMLEQSQGVGFFNSSPCLDRSIVVGGVSEYDSSSSANTLPTTLPTGETASVTVTMTNTGSVTWPTDGTIVLYSRNSPTSLYGVTIIPVDTSTSMGSSFTFTFTIQAPATAGTYPQRWQMLRTGMGGTFFGDLVDVSLTVTDSPASNDAAVVSQTIPTLVTAGEPATFLVEMQNTGTSAWDDNYLLHSQTSPISLWSRANVPVSSGETVAAGANKTFSIPVVAPATPGTYDSRWRMFQGGGAFFGEQAFTTVEVTLCGNGVIDAGEDCDDDNLVDGDGCDSTCVAPGTRTIDLAVDTPDRSFVGTVANRQLGNVTIGDTGSNGSVEVLMADNTDYQPMGGSNRSLAGVVYGFAGGAGFFTNSSTTLPGTPLFRAYGAEAGDYLGATGVGALVIGDVTGDGAADLIVAASRSDGPANARVDAGEVYVLDGSMLTGEIDLAASPAALVATISGATAGDRLGALAATDVTNDGVADLILGAQYADTVNGVDSGVVYVLAGGAGITGAIDLASTPGVQILGPSANARLGQNAAAGNVIAGTGVDLLVGAGNATAGGRSRTGAAFAVAGPVTMDVNTALGAGVAGGPAAAWFGETQNDVVGSAVEIGNVAGGLDADVVIGGPQVRQGPDQYGAVDVWAGPIASGSTFDLSSGTMPTVRFAGADLKDNAGTSLALGDYNNDGYMDVPVVAVVADGPANTRDRSGEMSLYLGASGLTGVINVGSTPPTLRVYGDTDVALLGAHYGNISFGDIDGDGFDDVCVGTYRGGPSRVGRVDCVESDF